MGNEIYFNKIKSQYDSLADMFIKNNVLYYKNYTLPLSVNLNSFNTALFLLSPENIINIIYIYQLLSKNDLTTIEIESLIKYAKMYFEIKNNSEKANLQFGYSIPIFMAYEPEFENYKGSQILREEFTKLCDSYEKTDSAKNAQYVRVLKNNNIPANSEYDDYLEFSEKINQLQNAGFTVIFLILFMVTITIITLLALTKRGLI